MVKTLCDVCDELKEDVHGYRVFYKCSHRGDYLKICSGCKRKLETENSPILFLPA